MTTVLICPYAFGFSLTATFGEAPEQTLRGPVSRSEILTFRAKPAPRIAPGTLITGYWMLSDSEGAPVANTKYPWQIETPNKPPTYRFIGEGLPAGRYHTQLHYWTEDRANQRRRKYPFVVYQDLWIDRLMLGGESLTASTTLTILDAVDIPLDIRSRSSEPEKVGRLSVIFHGAHGQGRLKQLEAPVRYPRAGRSYQTRISVGTPDLPLEQAIRWQARLNTANGALRSERGGQLLIRPWPIVIDSLGTEQTGVHICLRSPAHFQAPIKTYLIHPYRDLLLDPNGCTKLSERRRLPAVIRIGQTDSLGLRARVSVERAGEPSNH